MKECPICNYNSDVLSVCPICTYNGTFKPYGTIKRPNSECPICRSLERHRLLYFILTDELKILDGSQKKILHFAPSEGLYYFFSNNNNFEYHPKDFNPEHYVEKFNIEVEKFDMCSDYETISSDLFDVILSSHVLEHPKCDTNIILEEHHRILKPGGVHIISAAMKGNYTKESENYIESPNERSKLFDGRDHWRRFGHKDFPLKLESIFNNCYCSDMFKKMSIHDRIKYSVFHTSFYISFKE